MVRKPDRGRLTETNAQRRMDVNKSPRGLGGLPQSRHKSQGACVTYRIGYSTDRQQRGVGLAKKVGRAASFLSPMTRFAAPLPRMSE